jgi:hypothetical protein
MQVRRARRTGTRHRYHPPTQPCESCQDAYCTAMSRVCRRCWTWSFADQELSALADAVARRDLAEARLTAISIATLLSCPATGSGRPSMDEVRRAMRALAVELFTDATDEQPPVPPSWQAASPRVQAGQVVRLLGLPEDRMTVVGTALDAGIPPSSAAWAEYQARMRRAGLPAVPSQAIAGYVAGELRVVHPREIAAADGGEE